MQQSFRAGFLWAVALLTALVTGVASGAIATEQVRSDWVYPGPDGKLVYKTTPAGDKIMDFSHAGYLGGGVPLPGENTRKPRPFGNGPLLPEGLQDSPGRPVTPQSLYLAQLAERLGPKPADGAVERRAHPQPTVPDGAKEMPFEETAPEPSLTEPEKERGYLLFQRPLTESIYPNTRPLADERIDSLVAFATPGQFEPVTLALYPVRSLQNLKVRVSPLASSSGEVPASGTDVRLATYWNVGYPAYTTLGTYRRVPELLERVTVHSSPAGECQWYWLTVHVPDDAKPGLYRGSVSVSDDGFGQAVEIPLTLRVLGFRLQKDPRKHLSAYFYVRNRALYKGRDEAFIRRAADQDYQAMVQYGLDMLPTLYLGCPDGQRIVLAESGELERMLAAGLKGPAPVTADNVIARIYRDTTPGGKRENHWRIDPLPGPAFYERVTELFRAFDAERKAKGWPEFICCPIDEVDASCKEFGAKVYAAVKAADLRTYATKDPIGADAADYAPYLDVWCSQPYSVPYDRIVSQNRYEYWCYPNHNAGEVKDRRTMCKGGRMTYGFGFWRSGYTTLIPWHWCWPSEPDPFDYLRGRYSGCGQRVDDDGEVIPAVYWACFREGYDDARYLYTLQQAIVEREGSKNPGCLAAVGEGRRLLQETWDAIHVQPKYLADGMWPSEEFDAVRWRLAAQTAQLLEYPAATKAVAPSVLPAALPRKPPAAETPSPYEAAARAGCLETLVGEVSLLRVTAPAITGMDAPRQLLLPRSTLAFTFDVIGTAAVAKGSHTVTASLEEVGGAVRAQGRQDLADPHRMALPLTASKPGTCTLRLTINDATGKQCSEWAQPVNLHAGPLY